MANLIHLSLLLATTQLLFASSNSDKIEVNIASLVPSQPWNISCKDARNIWQLELTSASKLSLKCTGEHPNSDKCLKITVSNSVGFSKVMKKKCCRKDKPNCSGCQDTLDITVTNVLPLKITMDKGCWISNSSTGSNNSTDTSLKPYFDERSWIEAFKHCRSLNSSLVEITNQNNDELSNLLNMETDLQDGAWVGLERSIFRTNLDWMWISGSKGNTTAWNSSFPVGRWNNHCGKVIWIQKSEEFKLLHANCHDRLPYICHAVPV